MYDMTTHADLTTALAELREHRDCARDDPARLSAIRRARQALERVRAEVWRDEQVIAAYEHDHAPLAPSRAVYDRRDMVAISRTPGVPRGRGTP